VFGCEIEDHGRNSLLADICAKDERNNGDWETRNCCSQDAATARSERNRIKLNYSKLKLK
jgi:hypothetical protein